jgi:hypothetical protein
LKRRKEMTTRAAEELYRAQHNYAMQGKRVAIYNPENKPIQDLPIIYGFNNGGNPGWLFANLVAEDGAALGGHVCSHECYMPHDLGILEGTREDRHKGFRDYYPGGYRMEFVDGDTVRSGKHERFENAMRLNKETKGLGHVSAEEWEARRSSYDDDRE